MKDQKLAILLLTFSLTSLKPAFGEQVFKSQSGHAALVELFTSEGCSSCPPADQIFSRLMGSGGLWRSFVPVAYHVDYWNSPWRDPLSSSKWTQRQSQYGRGLVTPDLVVDGERSDGWSRIPQVSEESYAQVGVLEAKRESDVRYVVTFKPVTNMSGLRANVALLGFAIAYDVTSGENSGKTLTHDFAALSEASDAMKSEKGLATAVIQLPTPRVSVQNKGVAIWITREGSRAPIQATGGVFR